MRYKSIIILVIISNAVLGQYLLYPETTMVMPSSYSFSPTTTDLPCDTFQGEFVSSFIFVPINEIWTIRNVYWLFHIIGPVPANFTVSFGGQPNLNTINVFYNETFGTNTLPWTQFSSLPVPLALYNATLTNELQIVGGTTYKVYVLTCTSQQIHWELIADNAWGSQTNLVFTCNNFLNDNCAALNGTGQILEGFFLGSNPQQWGTFVNNPGARPMVQVVGEKVGACCYNSSYCNNLVNQSLCTGYFNADNTFCGANNCSDYFSPSPTITISPARTPSPTKSRFVSRTPLPSVSNLPPSNANFISGFLFSFFFYLYSIFSIDTT